MTANEKKNLLSVMESDTRWLAYLQEQKYRKIAICGYREFGRILYNKLITAGFGVPFIVERNYEALKNVESAAVPIIGFQDKTLYAQADILLLTPDLDYGIIKECMELAGIDIESLLLTDIFME